MGIYNCCQLDFSFLEMLGFFVFSKILKQPLVRIIILSIVSTIIGYCSLVSVFAWFDETDFFEEITYYISKPSLLNHMLGHIMLFFASYFLYKTIYGVVKKYY